MDQSTHSEACCTIPPVIVKGYEPKGKYEDIGGLKTYVVGPSDATKAILVIYDIFGYFPQTLQGADILSEANKHQKYAVFMPDWFKGKPADISWYPPTTEEHKKNLGAFFSAQGAPPATASKIKPYLKDVESKYSSIKEWGVLGFCWGGKIISLTSGPDTSYKAAALAHPAMVDPKDAENISIPFLVLPSKDESKDDIAGFEAALKGPKKVEWFDDQVHGWMAARGLENEKGKQEYERGYKLVAEWFDKHLRSNPSSKI
ncbi:dienelactone hydrolase family protein-like protein [Xylogone sp. PMI_703]|nr:dienelactone hydrolase family protein-like protein [Xylogone sp. PMI_703]